MTVERGEAKALLDDVDGIENRVRQLLIYSRVSDYLFLWGLIWALGFTCSYFLRTQADALWYGLEAAGLIGTVAIVYFHRKRAESSGTFVYLRAALSVVAIIAFGILWISLSHMGWREQITFWPTLLSFFLFLIGLWIGRGVALAALAIFTIALTGYFVAGDYLHLWMAAATGGAMLAGGFWLRR